jgi:hypothetical protein
MRFLWPVLGLCACWYVLAQCAGESDASTLSRIAQWRLSQRPVIDIGVASGDPVYELTDAASSVRLDDGTVVIADVGAGELRFFDATGRFQFSTQGEAALGRPGAARRGRLREWHTADGNGVAFETSGERLLFDGRGTLVREEPGGDPPSRIHGRTLLLGGTRESQANALQALDRLPPVDTTSGFRIVRLDDAGYLWVEDQVPDPRMRRPWLIYDRNANVVGRLITPASFDPQHIGADFVLGRWRDGNGIEHVQMYGLTRDERVLQTADTAAFRMSPAPAGPARHRAATVALRQVLQRVALLQESHWAKTMTYASDLTALDIELPKGVRISIVAASVGGWRAFAHDAAADAMCGIGAGRELLGGWKEGVPVCE